MAQQIRSPQYYHYYHLTDGQLPLVACMWYLSDTNGLLFPHVQNMPPELHIASEMVIGGPGPRPELNPILIRHRVMQLLEACHDNFIILVEGTDNPILRLRQFCMQRARRYFSAVTWQLSRQWGRRLCPNMVQYLVLDITMARANYLRHPEFRHLYPDNVIACDANIMLINIITHEHDHGWTLDLNTFGWNLEHALDFLLDSWETRELLLALPQPVPPVQLVSLNVSRWWAMYR